MKEKTEKIKTADGMMGVFTVTPEAAPRGAIIVLQEAFGVNAHMKEMCRRFAEEGYLAAAPELFHRFGESFEVSYEDVEKIFPLLGKTTNAQMLEDITQTFNFLEKTLNAKNIFSVGYCMGGFASILAAVHLPLTGAISYYGGGMVSKREGIGFSPIVQDFDKIKCSTLFFYGGDDKSISPADIKTVEQNLKDHNKKYTVKVYPGAGHAFSNDDRPSFDAAATEDAWKITLSWLAEQEH